MQIAEGRTVRNVSVIGALHETCSGTSKQKQMDTGTFQKPTRNFGQHFQLYPHITGKHLSIWTKQKTKEREKYTHTSRQIISECTSVSMPRRVPERGNGIEKTCLSDIILQQVTSLIPTK